MANKSAAAWSARRLGSVVQELSGAATSGGSGSGLFDLRGYEKLTVVWPPNSSESVARVGRALATSTAHWSTGNLDIMTVTGTSGGSVGSTAVEWDYCWITTATSGSTAISCYVGLT